MLWCLWFWTFFNLLSHKQGWIHYCDEHFSIYWKERISLFIVKKGCCCSGYAGYIPSYYPPPPVFNTGTVILHPGENKLQKAHFFAVVIFGSIPPINECTFISSLSQSFFSLCRPQEKGEGGWNKNETAKRAGLFLYNPFTSYTHAQTNPTFCYYEKIAQNRHFGKCEMSSINVSWQVQHWTYVYCIYMIDVIFK